jgi:hypothetical protein
MRETGGGPTLGLREHYLDESPVLTVGSTKERRRVLLMASMSLLCGTVTGPVAKVGIVKVFNSES